MGYNTVSIGNQGFDDIRENKYFYIVFVGYLFCHSFSPDNIITLILSYFITVVQDFFK